MSMCLRFNVSIIFCAILLLFVGSIHTQAAEWRHRDIWLKNEWGERVTPMQNISEPYSPRKTCGTCHGYSTITSGYHFRQGFDEMRDSYDKSRPWILSPGIFGKGCSPGITSGRVARKKNSSPKEIDLSTYDWIGAEGKFGADGTPLSLACGWTHPGGGPLEYGRKPNGKPDFSKTLIQGEIQNKLLFDGDFSSQYTPDRQSHFRESGGVEGDCMLCHMAGYDINRRNFEISRRNYRWAAAAGAGFGEIRGSVFEHRDKKTGPEQDAFLAGTWNFSQRPSVIYFWGNRKLFTKKGMLNGRLISRTVSSKNCLQCHRDMDARKSGTLYAASYDVHSAAGFQCTDCHGLVGNTKAQRLKHQIAKGWSPEGTVRNKLDGIGMKTCVSCHIEGQYRQTRANLPKEVKNPTKVHSEKFPRASSHFSLLHCAACHSTGQSGKGMYLVDASTGSNVWYTADSFEKAGLHDDTQRPASPSWTPWMTRYEQVKGSGEKYIPCLSQTSQWFGEKLENGVVRPISLRSVRQAFKGVRGITVVEVKTVTGEKVKEPTVATESDVRSMINALAHMGFKNVVFVADRIYEVRHNKVIALETLPYIRGYTFPAYSKDSQWFGERQDSGEIKPINLQYVLQAFRSIESITMAEGKSTKGKMVMEPVIATNADIRIMIKALTDMGFKEVIFMANRIYEFRDGKLKSAEIPPSLRGTYPAKKISPWFGEKLANGEIKPISIHHVRRALGSLKGFTLIEIKNTKGEKMMEPTIATDADIKRMIKALSDQGMKNIVFISNRLYEVLNGKLVSSQIAPAVSRSSYPIFHNVSPVEKKKTYGAKGNPEGCLDCHGENSPFFTRMKVLNVGRFLKENYPIPKEPNAEPQMYEWGIRTVPPYE